MTKRDLRKHIDAVEEAGRNGISYVGQANYHEREAEARQQFLEAVDKLVVYVVTHSIPKG